MITVPGLAVETVRHGTPPPWLLLGHAPGAGRGGQRLEAAEAVLAYLVTVLAAVELLVGGDGEAERALDHGPDGPRVHVAPLRSTQCHRRRLISAPCRYCI